MKQTNSCAQKINSSCGGMIKMREIGGEENKR
jgi:hypothetical protein